MNKSFIVAESKFGKLKSSLKLFCDKDSIWRLKTRLNQLITFSYNNKCPILLRSQSHFTMLVILKIHEKTYHSGVGVTLSNIRELYWIVKGRQVVKKVLRKCVLCKVVQGQTITPPETPYLPSFRINCNHAFEHVGVDYAGPIFYKNVNKQSTELLKCYILLITCAVTRAIHIEVTPDVGSYSLKLALIRFFSRRGVSKFVISDNFKSFKSIEIKDFLRKKDIKWEFILEKSPWWGGFYERLIGITKLCLKKCMGKSRLTYDETVTFSIEAESIVNSRPLTYVDDDPNNDVLTPSQLVYGRKLNDKCFTYNTDITDPEELRTLARKVESTKDYFYKRLEKEYLLSLQERCYSNRIENECTLVIGDVVLIKEENKSRMLWRKGLVTKLIKGKDNLIRGAKLKVYQPSLSKCTHINRPLQLLVPFEVTQERTPDGKEITNRTDNSIEKLVKPRHLAAQNADILRRLTTEDE